MGGPLRGCWGANGGVSGVVSGFVSGGGGGGADLTTIGDEGAEGIEREGGVLGGEGFEDEGGVFGVGGFRMEVFNALSSGVGVAGLLTGLNVGGSGMVLLAGEWIGEWITVMASKWRVLRTGGEVVEET